MKWWKKLIWAPITILGAALLLAQSSWPPPIISTVDPIGACANGTFWVNITTPELFYCGGSVWNSAGGAIPNPLNTVAIEDKGGQVFNVKAYGVVGDGVFLYACSASNGNTTVTCSTASFVAADVGKNIEIDNTAGSAPKITTIASVTDSTHVVVASAPGFTNANASVVYGTDDTTAINNLIASVYTTYHGGTIFFPRGVYVLNGTIGGPDLNSALLYPPSNPISASTATYWPTVTMEGQGMPMTGFPQPTNYKALIPNGASILYGMTYDASAVADIFSGPRGGSPVFNASTFVFRNLEFVVRNNPDLSGLDLFEIENAIVEGVTVTVNVPDTSLIAQPTHTQTRGIRLSNGANAAMQRLSKSQVYGMYIGVAVHEHTFISNLFVQNCIYGITLGNTSVKYGVNGTGIVLQFNKYMIQTGGGYANLSVDIEEANGAVWYATTTDILQASTDTGIIYLRANHSATPLTSLTITNPSPQQLIYLTGVGLYAGAWGMPKFAFASLPTCSATYEGFEYVVNDSTTNTHGATITGGSTNHVKAYCDGTNWVVEYP